VGASHIPSAPQEELDLEKFLKEEKSILLLLNELNQHIKIKGATDMVPIVYRLAGTSRSQFQIKTGLRCWEIFRKRLREAYPKL
jgi:hypothetical protein